MSVDYMNETGLRHELWVDGQFYGRWFAGDVEFGSEISDDRDPEHGNFVSGGRQTGGDLELSRPWRRDRDPAVYKALKARRGRAPIVVNVFELDDDDQPVSSTPTDVLVGTLQAVTKPEGAKTGDAAASLVVSVRVNP
ncbi:MAG: hypothetical protein AB7G37_00940 [Solirubrobacteraceae bacterium]